MTETTNPWIRATDPPVGMIAEWCRAVGDRVYARVVEYATGLFTWQVRRDDYLHTQLATELMAAMGAANDALAMPIADFRRLITRDLDDQIARLEKERANLDPDAPQRDRYQTGFAAGLEEARRQAINLLSALEFGPGLPPPEAPQPEAKP